MYLVMPLPLNMFDDHNKDNMITALDAFQHIIDNTVSKYFFSCEIYDDILEIFQLLKAIIKKIPL